jgi:hypothetical protein
MEGGEDELTNRRRLGCFDLVRPFDSLPHLPYPMCATLCSYRRVWYRV